MREDTLSTDIGLSGEIVESSAASDIIELPRKRTWPRYGPAFAHIIPFLTFSMLLSASATGAAQLHTILGQESSVILGRQRPTRRRVTLAQARQFALEALHMAEAARSRFAEVEGAYFADRYEWSGR